jgi:hypothetical protein
LQKAVLDHRAEHGAIEIDERKDHGLLPEVPSEGHGFAGFIPEHQIERNLLVQFLVNTYVSKNFGTLIGPWRLGASRAPGEQTDKEA